MAAPWANCLLQYWHLEVAEGMEEVPEVPEGTEEAIEGLVSLPSFFTMHYC